MHAETFNPLHAAMHADLVALYPLPYALRILPAISSMICSKYVLVEKYISNSLPWPGWEAGRQIYRPRYIACSTSLVVISEQITQNVIRQFAFISNQICPVRKAKTIFTNAVRKTKTRGATRESRDRVQPAFLSAL